MPPPSARALATQILARVEATDAFLNVVLDEKLSESRPKDPRDASLVTELVYGTTRRRLSLDAAISSVSSRKLTELEDRVLAALRLGAYQLFFTRIPARAAVAETVEVLKELSLDRAVGFANAILRKLSAMSGPPLPPPSDLVAHLSVRESHPEWLVSRWIRQFGPERAEQMLVANNLPAPVVVRANASKISRDELLSQWKEAGVSARATEFSPVGIVLETPGKIEDLFGYSEGLFAVQDEAAQLVGVFGAIPDGARVWDTCAAPGGKACHHAERLEVLASDLHENKLRKIESEAKRLGVFPKMTLRAHDAQEPAPDAFGEFHAVVIDAPCTGLGTLRRHPELRYRRQEADVQRLAKLQRKILQSAQAAVPGGGLLVYAVCSVDPEEGQDQVEMFLRSHPDFTAEPPNVSVSAQHKPLPLAQAYLRTLPGPEGMDGFFAARLRRMY